MGMEGSFAMGSCYIRMASCVHWKFVGVTLSQILCLDGHLFGNCGTLELVNMDGCTPFFPTLSPCIVGKEKCERIPIVTYAWMQWLLNPDLPVPI